MIPKWWNIVVAFSAFMIQLITFGVAGAIGIYNIELIKFFDIGAAEVSLIGSINLGVFLGAGPIVSLLMRHLSCRQVSIMGSILSGISLLCIPFVDHIIYMYVIYGIFTGFGFAMAYMPSSVLAGLYFDKHRSLATGVVTSGSGLGGVICPLLVHTLIEYYGWRGSLFILAGLMFQCVAFSALLFPIEEKHIKEEAKKQLVGNTSNIPDNHLNTELIPNNSENYKEENLKNGNNTEVDHDLNGHVLNGETDQMLVSTGTVKNNSKENVQSIGENNSKDKSKEEKTLEHCYVLCDFPFFIFFLNNIFWNMGAAVSWVLGPEYYVEMGLSKENAATVVTFSGAGCFIGCIIGGGLGNIKSLDRLSMYIAWNIIVGVFMLILPFKVFQTTEILCVIVTVSGLAFGGILGLLVIFTVDLLGEKALGDAFGYLMFSNGVGALIGPPIGGSLKDTFGSYDSTFIFAATLVLIGSFVMFLIPLKNRCSPDKSRSTKELTIHVEAS